MATSINRNNEKINEQLWGVLLRGAGVMNKSHMPENPSPSIITLLGWELAYFI
jgi:hypothetical protein